MILHTVGDQVRASQPRGSRCSATMEVGLKNYMWYGFGGPKSTGPSEQLQVLCVIATIAYSLKICIRNY